LLILQPRVPSISLIVILFFANTGPEFRFVTLDSQLLSQVFGESSSRRPLHMLDGVTKEIVDLTV